MPNEDTNWRFLRFGLIVTGQGERDFLEGLFRSLTASGHCAFTVIRRVEQLTPRTSPKHVRQMVGTTKQVPTRDQELGLTARAFLQRGQHHFVLLVDDLEHARRPFRAQVYARYRAALDSLLKEDGPRAAVMFLVNMLEAYYFAHASAINSVLGTHLNDYEGDVEDIRHPKNTLREISPGFRERRDGEAIVSRLDVPHVLARPDACGALRTAFGWCLRALGETSETRFQLVQGVFDDVTRPQIDNLAAYLQKAGS